MNTPKRVPLELIQALRKDPIYGRGAEEMIRQGKWIIDDVMEVSRWRTVKT